MIVVQCEQGSKEWVQARLGIPTASCFDKIVTAAKLNAVKGTTVEGYRNELLAEWRLGREVETFKGSYWTDRGLELEAAAIDLYRMLTDDDAVKLGGFVYKDEDRMVGCSPDWLTETAGVEVKCPSEKEHVGYLRKAWGEGTLPDAHILQVQGGLWVTGLPLWRFFSYHPEFPPVLLNVTPENRYQAAFDEHLPKFIADTLAARRLFREHGVRGALD